MNFASSGRPLWKCQLLEHKMSIARKLARKPKRLPQYFQYLYYHKILFGITNTKFDISFTVFRESFLDDQYGLREFARAVDGTDSLLFVDIGRNHGLVFYYFLYFLKKSGISIGRIDYVGIDPSPIKFAYFHQDSPEPKVTYRLIDKAVVFDDAPTVRLKYGENNLGNFNVAGSNYEDKMKAVASQRSFIEIEVDTLPIDRLMDIIRGADRYSTAIIKIDCKNRTERIMEQTIALLEPMSLQWHVACERDGSAEGRLKDRTTLRKGTLMASSIGAEPKRRAETVQGV